MSFLYNTFFGRILLKFLTLRPISKAVGWFLDTKISKIFVNSFIRKHNIDISKCKNTDFRSFNAFFTRKEERDFEKNPLKFISPCDGDLSIYRLNSDSNFQIKGTTYTLDELLATPKFTELYKNGCFLVFRLSPNHYHRYCYVDNCEKSENVHIKGILHTVRPIAFMKFAPYKTNSREFSVLKTDNFGEIIQIEVGALCVGKISNLHNSGFFEKGTEKGYFEFGGSTIILILQDKTVNFDDVLLQNMDFGIEIPVKYGQVIGIKI
jgi:phosphatidylserine decarboxylase